MTNSFSFRKSNFAFTTLQSGLLFLSFWQILLIASSLIKLKITRITSLLTLSFALSAAVLFFIFQSKNNPLPISIKFEQNWKRNLIILTVLGSVVFLLLGILAVESPDFSWDGNAYHIPTISFWASKGYIHWIDQSFERSLMNGYPKGAEAIAYGAAMSFGNDFLNTLNLWFLPIGVLGIISLCISLGISSLPVAVYSGLLFILIPVNLYQSQTTYVDTALASCLIGFIALWIDLLQRKKISFIYALIFGLAIGLTLSIKSSAFLVVGLGLIILVFKKSFEFFRTKKNLNREERKPRQAILIFVLIIITASISGGYWYIRNYVITGSPLYPVGLTLNDQVIFPGVTISKAISENANTPPDLISESGFVRVAINWLQGLSKWPSSIQTYDSRYGSLGFFWIIACIPALLLTLFSGRKIFLDYKNLLYLIILVAIGFVFSPMNWWARYTVWIYALGLPVFALFTDGFFRKRLAFFPNLLLRLWSGLALFIVLFEGIFCLSSITLKMAPGLDIHHPSSLFQAETWIKPDTILVREMNGTVLETLITSAKHAAIGPRKDAKFYYYVELIGQLSQPVGERCAGFVKESVSVQEMVREGCDYLLWDESIPISKVFDRYKVGSALGYSVYYFPDQ